MAMVKEKDMDRLERKLDEARTYSSLALQKASHVGLFCMADFLYRRAKEQGTGQGIPLLLVVLSLVSLIMDDVELIREIKRLEE